MPSSLGKSTDCPSRRDELKMEGRAVAIAAAETCLRKSRRELIVSQKLKPKSFGASDGWG
jgi:hypothetical protein